MSLLGRLFATRTAASVPAGMRVYAIGDIHGRLDLLKRLLGSIARDGATAAGTIRLVFLGDYVDRGPDSRGVIDTLLALPKAPAVTVLRGNHDQLLLDFLVEPAIFRRWRDYGAYATLLSYGVTPPRFDDEGAFEAARRALLAAMPPAHLAFLRTTPLSAQIGGYFFAHAGIRPGTALDAQEPEDLMWIREAFLSSRSDFGAVVVHGHTPMAAAQRAVNRISVDTGAYATGRLSAVVLETDTCRFLHT